MTSPVLLGPQANIKSVPAISSQQQFARRVKYTRIMDLLQRPKLNLLPNSEENKSWVILDQQKINRAIKEWTSLSHSCRTRIS